MSCCSMHIYTYTYISDFHRPPLIGSCSTARPLSWLHIWWMSKECGYMPQTLVMMELRLHKRRRVQGEVAAHGKWAHSPSVRDERSQLRHPFCRDTGEEGLRGRSLSSQLSQWERRKSQQQNNSGLLFWRWTQRQRVQSERHTQTLCEPAAGRLHLGYIHTDTRITFPRFLHEWLFSQK